MSAQGVKETLEVISFFKTLALTIEETLKDGKVDLFDSISAIKLTPSLIAAVSGFDKVKEEFKDLDSKEKDFLLQETQDALFLMIRALKLTVK